MSVGSEPTYSVALRIATRCCSAYCAKDAILRNQTHAV